MRTKVYAELPRTGMCNRLFVWANAYLFSHEHNLPLFINGWQKTQIGPWIRREKNRRIYINYFKTKSDSANLFVRKLFFRRSVYYNAHLTTEIGSKEFQTFIFNKLPDSGQYFTGLKEHTDLLRRALENMIKAPILEQIGRDLKPQIGVHVRRGDFVTNGLMENLRFYKNAIQYVRTHFDSELTVMIFSDGHDWELKELLELPGVKIFKGTSDIEEMMVLSKSDFIITSLHSTFSYWAAFLSKALIIHNSNYKGAPMRENEFVRDGEFILERIETNVVTLPGI